MIDAEILKRTDRFFKDTPTSQCFWYFDVRLHREEEIRRFCLEYNVSDRTFASSEVNVLVPISYDDIDAKVVRGKSIRDALRSCLTDDELSECTRLSILNGA